MLTAANITMQFGAKPLFENINAKFGDGNRYGLIGANGCGKSTFMKILGGDLEPSSGTVVIEPNVRLGKLSQDQFAFEEYRVLDVVMMGHKEMWAAMTERDALYANPEATDDDYMRAADLEAVYAEFGGYEAEARAGELLLGAGIPLENHNGPMSEIAPGWKLRVLLAQALFSKPDVLLLDEPTNHLDIPSIELLEEQIRQFKGAVIFVSHDRSFMRKLATRVCDLDRGMLKSWSGGYEGFLKGKAEFLHAQEKANALFDKKLAEEEVWIRRGIEARRTRNEGRVRALMEMRKQFSDRRNVVGSPKVQVQEAERSGKVVAELTDINKQLGDLPILRNFTNTILRGEKIGFLGPNGIGKTTALKVLLGQLPPDSGHIKLGTKLEIAYFDQLRSQFNEEDTAVEIIGAGKEFITIDGQAKHVIGYLQDFLFTPDRARQPVRSLSGGERARLILAQLFSTPSNVMVLDEPTNDLD
ncbi:MAG TPA: ABC transporter ATP-binding protein, partial [Limnobacter sp.]|nr:ABC transporter ATP-binding protein [Limnobacter sp.]